MIIKKDMDEYLKQRKQLLDNDPDMQKHADVTCKEFLEIAAYISHKSFYSYIKTNPSLLITMSRYTALLAEAIFDNLEEVRKEINEIYKIRSDHDNEEENH